MGLRRKTHLQNPGSSRKAVSDDELRMGTAPICSAARGVFSGPQTGHPKVDQKWKDCQVFPSEDESTQHQEKIAVAGFKPGGHAQAPAGRESSFCRGKRKVGGLSTQSPSFSLAGPHQTVHVSAWPCRGESSPCWSPDCLTEVSVRG